ncbi:MAG: hypothetical protein JKX86_02795, partial [Verrucomicrobiales bacterium]|nr:hypothetical protein [Verrucomicrobiales bacterium]
AGLLGQSGPLLRGDSNPQGVNEPGVAPDHPDTVGLEPLRQGVLLGGNPLGLVLHRLAKGSATEAGLFLLEIKCNQRLPLELYEQRQRRWRLDRLGQRQAGNEPKQGKAK